MLLRVCAHYDGVLFAHVRVQAFVSGDPRGHRVAKVLKVLKGEPEYPLRLESQELCVSIASYISH